MTGEQTIFRAHRTERDRWTPVLNQTIRDPNLSFRATGLLIYLLSLPGDWRANQQHIATCKKEGREAVITAWNELREFGYLNKELIREKGKIVSTVWHVYETSTVLPENRKTVQPETVHPETENTTLRSKEGNEEQKDKEHVRASEEEVSYEFERFWRAYPRKTAKGVAEKAFVKNNVFDKIEVVLAAIEEHKKTRQWQEGVYPHPATWINQSRWNDDLSHEQSRKDKQTSPRGPQSRNATGNAKRAADYAGLGRPAS